jgi:hypothetical protein
MENKKTYLIEYKVLNSGPFTERVVASNAGEAVEEFLNLLVGHKSWVEIVSVQEAV